MNKAPRKPGKKATVPKADKAILVAREGRAACNQLNSQEREALFNEGMALIYGAAAARSRH